MPSDGRPIPGIPSSPLVKLLHLKATPQSTWDRAMVMIMK